MIPVLHKSDLLTRLHKQKKKVEGNSVSSRWPNGTWHASSEQWARNKHCLVSAWPALCISCQAPLSGMCEAALVHSTPTPDTEGLLCEAGTFHGKLQRPQSHMQVRRYLKVPLSILSTGFKW